MKPMHRPCLIAMLLAGLGGPATATGDREDLRAQRELIETHHREQVAACAQRFDLTHCRQQADARRSRALQPVIEREQRLAEQERQLRAQRQNERVEAKLQEPAASRPPRAPASAAPASPPRRSASRPDAAAREADRMQQARRKAEQAETRARQAQQRQRQIEARARDNAERQAARRKTPAAAPLPVPSASEIAALPPVRPTSSGAR